MPEADPLTAIALARAIKARRPVVHCLTNLVTIDWVARGLAAAGASPVMAADAVEAAEVAAHADAVVLNLGTWRPENLAAMLAAGHAAASRGSPIVLDPVGVGGPAARTEAARRLLSELPIVAVRGNAAEIAALAGGRGELRGIEAGNAVTAEAAMAAATRWHTLVVCTGATDVVAKADHSAASPGAHPMLAAVVGAGCLLTALLGAALAAAPADPWATAAATLQWHGACTCQAAAAATGPGSFLAAYLDALYAGPAQ